MPGKSRRGRARHSARGKKRQGTSAIIAQQRVAIEKPAAAEVPAPSPSLTTPKATPAGAQYHYVVAELQRIGIFAGIMLAILVILALVLP